jgi:hypothetical protein
MYFKDLWNRIKKYFSFNCFKRNDKAELNLDDDILEAEYGKLNDPENPNYYF